MIELLWSNTNFDDCLLVGCSSFAYYVLGRFFIESSIDKYSSSNSNKLLTNGCKFIFLVTFTVACLLLEIVLLEMLDIVHTTLRQTLCSLCLTLLCVILNLAIPFMISLSMLQQLALPSYVVTLLSGLSLFSYALSLQAFSWLLLPRPMDNTWSASSNNNNITSWSTNTNSLASIETSPSFVRQTGIFLWAIVAYPASHESLPLLAILGTVIAAVLTGYATIKFAMECLLDHHVVAQSKVDLKEAIEDCSRSIAGMRAARLTIQRRLLESLPVDSRTSADCCLNLKKQSFENSLSLSLPRVKSHNILKEFTSPVLSTTVGRTPSRVGVANVVGKGGKCVYVASLGSRHQTAASPVGCSDGLDSPKSPHFATEHIANSQYPVEEEAKGKRDLLQLTFSSRSLLRYWIRDVSCLFEEHSRKVKRCCRLRNFTSSAIRGSLYRFSNGIQRNCAWFIQSGIERAHQMWLEFTVKLSKVRKKVTKIWVRHIGKTEKHFDLEENVFETFSETAYAWAAASPSCMALAKELRSTQQQIEELQNSYKWWKRKLVIIEQAEERIQRYKTPWGNVELKLGYAVGVVSAFRLALSSLHAVNFIVAVLTHFVIFLLSDTRSSAENDVYSDGANSQSGESNVTDNVTTALSYVLIYLSLDFYGVLGRTLLSATNVGVLAVVHIRAFLLSTSLFDAIFSSFISNSEMILLVLSYCCGSYAVIGLLNIALQLPLHRRKGIVVAIGEELGRIVEESVYNGYSNTIETNVKFYEAVDSSVSYSILSRKYYNLRTLFDIGFVVSCVLTATLCWHEYDCYIAHSRKHHSKAVGNCPV